METTFWVVSVTSCARLVSYQMLTIFSNLSYLQNFLFHHQMTVSLSPYTYNKLLLIYREYLNIRIYSRKTRFLKCKSYFGGQNCLLLAWKNWEIISISEIFCKLTCASKVWINNILNILLMKIFTFPSSKIFFKYFEQWSRKNLIKGIITNFQ